MPTRAPEIAAIVVGYRDAAGVEAAVASLRAGTLAPGWIGVVDHSPAEDAAPRLPAGVELQRDPENPGFAAGVHRAAAAAPATADLYLLNPDARVGRRALQTIAGYLASRPDVGACTVPVDHDPATGTPWFEGGRVRAWLADVRHGRARGATGECDFISGASMWIRREAWDQVGPMDETLFLYGEDLDWCLRARAAGWRVAVAPAIDPEARVVHRVGASVTAAPAGERDRTYYIARNTWRVLRRHAGWLRLAPLGLPRLLWIGLRVPERSAWWRGVVDGLAGRGGRAPWSAP